MRYRARIEIYVDAIDWKDANYQISKLMYGDTLLDWQFIVTPCPVEPKG